MQIQSSNDAVIYLMHVNKLVNCGKSGVVFTPSRVALNFAFHHFRMDHNAPCLSAKTFVPMVLDFSWDDCNTQEKLDTMVMQNCEGKQGALWSMWK